MKHSETGNSMFLLLLHLFFRNKYVKQVVLIDHGSISTLYKRDRDWSSVILQKTGDDTFFIQKREKLIK